MNETVYSGQGLDGAAIDTLKALDFDPTAEHNTRRLAGMKFAVVASLGLWAAIGYGVWAAIHAMA